MTDVTAEILAAQHAFWEALKAKDRLAFERLLAEDFVGRSPFEPDQDRAAFIDTLVNFPLAVRTVASDNLAVHLFGEIAVVTGVQLSQIEVPGGELRPNLIALSNVFERRGAGWVLKLAHAVTLDAPWIP